MGNQKVSSAESEDRFHRHQWVVQRTGWLAMLVLIVAACLGYFGGAGIAAKASSGADASLKVEYERFGRYASESVMTFTVGAVSAAGQVAIEVDEAYLQAFDIQSISPEPKTARTSEGHLTLTFEVDALPATITLRLKPDRIGVRTGTFRLPNGPSVAVRQFIYP